MNWMILRNNGFAQVRLALANPGYGATSTSWPT